MKRAAVPSFTSLIAGHLKSGALKTQLKPKRKTKVPIRGTVSRKGY